MEWSNGTFGDLRLDRTGGAILEQMVARKTVCLRRLGGRRSGELRTGRFFASAKVTAGKIIEGWSDLTGPACAGRHILAIEDRSEVRFPTTAQRRRGLGPVGKGNAYGVLVQAMVAVDAESGACLGLVGGDVWTRPGVNPTPCYGRPWEERELVRWVDTAEQAKLVLRPAAQVTVVADREFGLLCDVGACAGAWLSSADPGPAGSFVGRRGQAVRRVGGVPRERSARA